MTIFDVIRYPISDLYTAGGLPGAREISDAFPALYMKWLKDHWAPFISNQDGFDYLKNYDVTPVTKELRRMLLERDVEYHDDL